MKKIFLLLFAVVGLAGLQSCEGPDGPPGVSVEAEVFEVTMDFTNGNNWESVFNFNPAILSSDHLLVYRLDGQFKGEDIWKMLPTTYFFDDLGFIIYDFNFTRFDFKIFMNTTIGNVDRLDGGAWTKKQTFRIVVVPGYFPNNRSFDTSAEAENTDYNTIIKKYHLENAPIKQLEAKK